MMHYGVHTQCCRAGRGGCSRAVSPSHPAGSRAELSHPLGRPPGTQRCPRGAISPGQLCAPQALGAARCEGDAAPRTPPRAQCWLCLQRPTALGRRLQGTLGACGLGVPPCASSTEQQCSTAELCSHTVHTWVQQRATPRRADVHSCRPSLPAPSAAHHRCASPALCPTLRPTAAP